MTGNKLMQLRIFLFGVMGSVAGIFIGIALGELSIRIGEAINISRSILLVITLLGIGGILVWYVLPLENRYLWQRIKRERGFIDDNEMSEYNFAPITFFSIVGMLLWIKFNY